ncbi:MAG: response regulator [Nitrosomonadales bacterium]
MILIVTDITTDANLVKDILKPEFNHVATSTDPEKLAVDFANHRPSVLVLAFNTLEKSEHYYLGLYRLCEAVHECPHRTIILCSKGELKQVYELCKQDHFDDYVLFWPMSQDSSRLLMSIHNALRELAALKTEGPSAAEFATQARHLAKLEKVLGQQVGQGSRQIAAANRAMEQAEQNIGAALDGLSRRLISDSLPGAEGVNSADGIKNAVDRFKREEIQQHFRTAAKSTQPLKRWAQEFKQECEPFLESARTLNAMAERIRPTVLVVDDDDLQRKLIGTLLEAENYRLVFASDGFDALNVVLRKTRPDIILMDVMMPGNEWHGSYTAREKHPAFFQDACHNDYRQERGTGCR